MKKAKIVVIGAGSASFGLANLGAILRTPELAGSELCLVDVQEDGLRLVSALAERLNHDWGSGFLIKSSTNRCNLLGGADFVILSVAIDREKSWKIDQDIALKHGIMHYAENGGPGALMHCARNIALIMPILRDIEKLCPNALVLNFTNPVPRICIAAARYTKVRMVGICHQIEFGYTILAKVLAKDLMMDVPDDYLYRWSEKTFASYFSLVQQAEAKIDMLAAGINHFTWMLSIRSRADGSDLYPLFRERYLNNFEEFEPLTRRLFRIFNLCPVPGDCHMAEYLPYTHNAARDAWTKYDIQMYPLEEAARGRDNTWHDIEAMASGAKPVDHLRYVHTERAELIMAGILGGTHAYEPAVNIPNHGHIANLPRGAIVEVPAIVGFSGVHGVCIGNLPENVAELCRRQITVAELAVEAAVKGDRVLAVQALALDPMVDDPDVAERLFGEYLLAQKEYLPQFY